MINQNQLRGYKATVHNPRVSDDAKDHAREILEEAGVGEERGSLAHNDDQGETEQRSTGNVLRGYKATLKNPNVGERAKEHAEGVLRDHGAQ